MPDFLPAAEVLAKGVKHVATYVADAIAERRKAFDDDEAGDYLRCAGADALAESLAHADPEVYGTAVRQPNGFLAEALCRVEEEQEVHEPLDIYTRSECYFCDRPTDRTGYDGLPAVCNVCAEVATQSPAAAIPPLATAADPAAAEPFPPSMTAAGSSNPFDDCGLFTAGAAFAADLDETISTVAELDWPDVAAALRVLANFLDPQ